ncbi:NrtR DNA-binding winged helix domain-containing protein [Gordonia iterans]
MANHELENFPRPGVTVDLAILTVTGATALEPELRVLILDRDDPAGHALPGAFMRERATVADTVADVFARKVGIAPTRDVHPRLLRVFDDPDRDDRTWAISIAHAVSIPEDDLADARGMLVPVGADGELLDGGPLQFDHGAIVTAAAASLRERYEFRHRYADTLPDPDHFLPEPFTLHQLRKVHEAVVGTVLHKDNFNRRMKPFLEPVLDDDGEQVLADSVRGRPAGLYRRVS